MSQGGKAESPSTMRWSSFTQYGTLGVGGRATYMPKLIFKLKKKKLTDFSQLLLGLPPFHSSFSPILCPSVHEVLMPCKVLAMLIKEKGETLLVFSLCTQSSFDLEGEERRAKSTVLPLKKTNNKSASLCFFCLQHSAPSVWGRLSVFFFSPSL